MSPRAHATRSAEVGVVTGHLRATEIAVDVLRSGGNAVDAGVAASIALTVLKSEQVQLGGVAPMLIRPVADGRVYAVEGVGRWPKATDSSVFERTYRGRLPGGVLRCVTPAAPDAWLTALARWGTRSFAELAGPARALAQDGFPAHPDLATCSAQFARAYARHAENAGIWLPGGVPIAVGDTFLQPGLGRTLDLLIQADRNGGRTSDRLAGLSAVRAAFYEGPLAQAMARHVEAEGGWLSLEDLAAHHTPVTPAVAAHVFGGTLFCCGPWSQGPALAQALQIAERSRLHSDAATDEATLLHLVLEALKLALADREAFYGDPDFVNCPVDALLSSSYAEGRASDVGLEASPGLPRPGRPDERPQGDPLFDPVTSGEVTLDTAFVAVADADGNLFTATPSDPSYDAPVVPGLGFVISTRGGQSRVDTMHPAALAPGKRPRVSACPFMLQTATGDWILGGGPGADFQLQADALVLARHLIGHVSLDVALAAPRVFTQSAPGSSSPHLCFPGQVLAEEELETEVFEALAQRGHRMVRAATQGIARPSVELLVVPANGSPMALDDPRRPGGTYAGAP